MRRKIVTIRDVAEMAGVSVSTVSHVLNGNDQHVGAVKRECVLKAVETLHYRPNAIARSMVKQQTATIGVVLTEVDNALFMPVVAGIEDILRPAGYHIVLASAPDIEEEKRAIETLRSQQVDGFIFMSLSTCTSNDHLLHLKDEGVPLVVINRCIDDVEINQISWADREAGYEAARHLISLGHTRIGTMCGPTDSPRKSAIERQRGWTQALEEYNIPIRAEWIVDGKYSYEGGYQAAKYFAALKEQGKDFPSALFIASDTMAVGALKALHQSTLQVPHDIAIVTTGDPPTAAYTIPALTTLSHPIHEAGHVAAKVLLDSFTGNTRNTQHITLSFKLIVRESCGAGARPEYPASSILH